MSGGGVYGLILEFDNDSHDFRRGFELGCMWKAVNMSDDEYGVSVHADCAEMVIRIAEATHRPFTSRDLNDGWIEVLLGPPRGVEEGDTE